MKIMADCAETQAKVTKGLDLDLTLRERFSMRFHLLMCLNCQAFTRQMAALRRLAHDLGRRGLGRWHGAKLQAKARARIRRALRSS